jgi:hypothetical protein
MTSLALGDLILESLTPSVNAPLKYLYEYWYWRTDQLGYDDEAIPTLYEH